jgi:hypothetical protein
MFNLGCCPASPHIVDNCSIVATSQSLFGGGGVDVQFLGRNTLKVGYSGINPLVGTIANYGIVIDPALTLNF